MTCTLNSLIVFLLQLFTTDPDIDISLEDINRLNLESKNDGAFAQNLALYFYGAEELQKRKPTTGNQGSTEANADMVPISPKKMKFIYSKIKKVTNEFVVN